MDDLIRRQDVIDIIMGDGIYCDTYEDKVYSAERIKNIPTVEPRKGKWIVTDGYVYRLKECSECGTKWFHPADDPLGNYCSECGARMEE